MLFEYEFTSQNILRYTILIRSNNNLLKNDEETEGINWLWCCVDTSTVMHNLTFIRMVKC